MHTNTNKNGKANTLELCFFSLCKLNFLPLETELLVQVVAKCYQLLCGNIVLKQNSENKEGEGKNKEMGGDYGSVLN